MCGIAGIILKHGADPERVRTTAESLQRNIFHRGPDSGGLHGLPDRAFSSRRLAIVGIAGGDQPIFSDSGRQGIVYNGEVYNYRELRDELSSQGHSFRTRTDTEVVLKGYLAEGPEAFRRLEGMYACCLWDEETGEVVLARDPFGMKPLYVYEDERRLIFSSELSAIQDLPDVTLTPDPQGIAEYLTFRYTTAPYTVFREVRRLAPGTYLRLRAGRWQEFQFEDLTDLQGAPSVFSFDEAKERLREIFLESVRSHLIGEVPIALLLSGGVDSSILGSLLWELGASMQCFNIGFPEVNEFAYASDVADKIGFPLTNVEITVDDLFENLGRILAALDEPLADPACFPLFLLCEHIKPHATVVLSGEGGDELFAGYPQYWSHREQLPARSRYVRFLQDSYYFLDNRDILTVPPELPRWERHQKHFQGVTTLASMSTFDLKTWMPDDLMMKADKVLMFHSLEGRFPFLYRPLVRLVRELPEEFLVSEEGEAKHVLKEAFRPYLPASVLERPKMGFSVPIALMLRRSRDEIMDHLRAARRGNLADMLRFDVLDEKFSRLFDGADDEVLRLWTVFVLVSWFNRGPRQLVARAA